MNPRKFFVLMLMLSISRLLLAGNQQDRGEIVTQTRIEIETKPSANISAAEAMQRAKLQSEELLKQTPSPVKGKSIKSGNNGIAGDTSEYYTKEQVVGLITQQVLKANMDSIINAERRIGQNNMEVQSTKLTVIVLAFGLLSMFALYFYTGYRKQDIGSNNLKLIGIIFIACAALCLITAGFNNGQITPVIGILGTMAGYLLSSGQGAKAQDPGKPAPIPSKE